MIAVDRFLDDTTGRFAAAYTAAIEELFVAIVLRNKGAAMDARSRLANVIADTMGVAEIIGATEVLELAAREEIPARFASEPTQPFTRVTFAEALESMVSRVPTVIHNAAERTALNIAKLYGEQSGGLARVAFVRSAESAVTDRVRELIAEAIREGRAEAATGRLISMSVDEIRERSGPWSEAYSRMAFRTNLNTAVTAGRFRQAQDPDVAAVIPCMRFHTSSDGDVRDNHRPMHDVVLKTDNPAWNRLAPPLGYNCRCGVALVTRAQLRRMGKLDENGRVVEDRVPAGAYPDPGFRHGGRPDLMVSSA